MKQSLSKTVLSLTLLWGIQQAKAQVFLNNGAQVTVQSGAVVHVFGETTIRDNGANQGVLDNSGNFWVRTGTATNGDFTNTNGAQTTLNNGSRLYVERHFTQDATFTANNGSTVIFNGTTDQTYERTPNANAMDSFYNVEIDNSATGNNGVRLATNGNMTISNMVVRNNINFLNGIIITTLPAVDQYPYPASGNYVHMINSAATAFTNTNPSAYTNRYIAGVLRRSFSGGMNDSLYFPIGDLRANAPTEKQMNQIAFAFNGTPTDYGSYITVYFRPAHTGTPVNTAECGNDGYDAWIGNGRWIVIPDNSAGTTPYNTTTHPRNYTAMYATLDYTQYTGNASATVQKANTNNTTWFLQGNCDPSSTLNPMGTAIVRRLNMNGFSEFAVAVDDDRPFPVEMLPLVAIPDNDNQIIKLYWNTLSEVNNAGFEIQRSLDGQNFAKIHPNAWVNGQGNSNQQVNYTYDDDRVEANVKYYYRLKQIDFNGAYKYSNIAEAILSKDFQFGVVFYPNPTNDQMNLTISSDKEQQISLTIYNAIGQQVFEKVYDVQQGSTLVNLDFFSNISKGVYTAVISNGSNVVTQKLVKVQ